MENQDITTLKRIEAYLSNQLNTAEKEAFELEIQRNPSLKKEVELQQQLHAGIKRATQRKSIQKIGKRYHFIKKVQVAVITVIIAISTILGAYFLSKNILSSPHSKNTLSLSLLDSLQKNAPIDRLKSEFFEWNGSDSVLLSKNGVLLSVPENSFLIDGKPYKGNAIIQWQEAVEAKDIIKSGLSTTSDGKLLETQGMFGVEAYTPKAKKLTVNPTVGLYVQVPVKEHKKGMKLFSGKKDKQGNINWVDPKPLEKIPVSIPMNKLNFYPNALVDTLNQLKKTLGRKYRDSLYLRLLPNSNSEIKVRNSEIKGNKNIRIKNKIKYYGKQFLGQEYMLNNPIDKIPVEKFKEWKWNIQKVNGDTFLLSVNQNIINQKDKTGLEIPFKDKQMYLSHLGSEINVLTFGNEKNENIQFINKIKKNRPNILTCWVDHKGFKMGNQLNDFYNYSPITLKNINLNQSFDKNWNDSLKIVFTWKEVATIYSQQFILRNKKLSKIDLEVFLPVFDNQSFNVILDVEINNQQSTYLPPSKVLAFWNTKFDNTNLATREFEQRIQVIHNICDASNRNKATTSRLLETYTSNLDKSIKYADEQAVKMGFTQFQSFVNENVGAVNPNNPHLKNLAKFYNKAIERLEQELVGYQDKDKSVDEFMQKRIQLERQKEQNRKSERNIQNLFEEYQLNLEDVYKQLGKTVSFTIGKDNNSTNIVNIDKYVMDATIARTTTTITDPETGKTAQITYHPFSLEVENHQKYNQLFVYLLPAKMNSFQRLNLNKGKLNYNLNNLMEYDVVVVGVTENAYYVSHSENIKKGDLGKLSLTAISEKELDKLLQKANKERDVEKPMSFKEELHWLKAEQQFTQHQTKRRNDKLFLERMRRIVYPCYLETPDAAGESKEPGEQVDENFK